MANYNEETIDGVITTWIRNTRIVVDNPYNDISSLTFEEEKRAVFPDLSTMTMPYSPSGAVTMSLDDPSENVSLIDPATGDSAGEISVAQIKIIFHSLYIRSAAERDANNV